MDPITKTANIGIVGSMIPLNDMPFDLNGVVKDFVINPTVMVKR